MSDVRRVCVYCGSRPGLRPGYAEAARSLGALLAAAGVGLVTGGGRVEHGVIPRDLADREVGHAGMTALHVVGSMHERKAVMADLADAFVALPGGLGTLEEIAEALTWVQLGIHAKPCGLLDVEGYYAPLVAFVDHAVDEGFVGAESRAALAVERDPAALLRRLGVALP